MEKRAHIRQPLDLGAQITIADHSAFGCRIKDFCLGGLFLDCQEQFVENGSNRLLPVVEDDWIQVDFAGSEGKQQQFRLQARVAGLFRGGMGVEFIKPDPGALLALQDIASRSQQAAESSASSPAPRVPGSPADNTHASCRQVVSKYLKGNIEAMFKLAGEELFVTARDATNDVEQNLRYDTMKEVEQLKAPIEKAFYDVVLEAIDHPGRPLKSGAAAQPDQGSGLSLLESQVFQDILSVQRIMEKIGTRYEDQLYVLLKRLSHIAGVELNDQNNPLGPVGLCAAFHDSLQSLGATRMARQAIFSAFEDTVIKDLDSLYDELNEVFERDNILPGIEKPKPHVPHQPHASEEERTPTEAASAAPAAATTAEEVPGREVQPPGIYASTAAPGVPHGAAGGTTTGHTAPGVHPSSSGVVAGEPQQGGPSASPQPTVPTATPAGEGSVPSSPPAAPANALRAARCLMGLNRQIASAAAPPTDGGAAAPPQPTAPTATYSTDEVLEALSSLRREPASGVEAPLSAPDLKSMVLASLESGHAGNREKQLDSQENDAIEVIAGLVGAILEDVLVADGMKPRIGRLEAPLVSAALQDEALLSDEAHPARQVVNQLGKIDLPATLEPGSREAQVGDEVDRLIEGINSNYSRDSGVFSQALAQIEALVKNQSEQYLESLAQTIKECGEEQKLLRGLRKDGGKKGNGQQDRGQSAGTALSPEWGKWMDRVKRLKTGDVLGLEKTGKIIRETLAWIDDDYNKFVFVDTKGRKSSAMTGQELAMQFHRGEANLLSEAELPAVERGLLSVFQKMHSQVAKSATHDPLTGLLSAKRFRARLKETLAGARRDHSEHILCHLELDNFSAINETCGRKAGDALLERFAKTVKKQLGARGYGGRLEGVGFAVVLENCDLEAGSRVADSYRHAVEQSRVLWKGELLPISLSVGVAPLTAETEDLKELQKSARNACREAFKEGGNRTRTVAAREETVDKEIPSPEQVASVLNENRFELFCRRVMPVSEQDQARPHYEVLLRLKDEGAEPAHPTKLLHAAERSGKMADIDRWTVHHTLHWMSRNKARLLKTGGICLTLAKSTLGDPQLTKFVLDEFTSSKVPPGKVLFEIPEAAAIDQLSVAGEFMQLMKEYGCRFSLGDFGSGTSSYSYLKQLPVDYVKIGGLFVKDMLNNESDLAMVKSINEVGHFMGKMTVAEQVDDEGMLEQLREIEVDYAQGSAFGEPVPLDELQVG